MKRYYPLFFAIIFSVLMYNCTRHPGVSINDNCININKDSCQLKVTVFSDNIIQVTYGLREDSTTKNSLVVVEKPQKSRWDYSFNDDILRLTTVRLKLDINLNTLNINYLNRSGDQILSENNREIVPDLIMGEKTFNIKQSFSATKEEGIYGLGQHQDGIMNFRNDTVILIQTNTVAVNPFLVSTKNYGILWDNYSKTIFTGNKQGVEFWSEVGNNVDYYFVAGDSMDEVIAGYRWLTGPAPMFGKWAYGFWQSKERYVDANDLLNVVKEYRDRKIPIDNIVQDWCYWADYNPEDKNATWQSAKAKWSSMEFNNSTYNNPEKTIKEIHDKYHMHYMISIWPALGPETAIYKEMNNKGFTYPPQHWSSGFLYDAYNTDARDIYWTHIKQGIMEKGVDALWMDGTEPELGDQHTIEVSEENIKKFGQTKLGSMARYLNTYSLMTTKGVYEGFRKDFPDKRAFILTRSAFSGQQRNASVTWSGDINARFDIFRNQISSGLNFCMAGIPYWTTDIGGFFVKGHDVGYGGGQYPEGHTDPSYRELYVRWFQFGVFCPIFRSHGTHTPREIWRFGEPGDWAYDALLKYDNLRYRLMPYIYSLAWKVTDEGYTMMRGLPMDFSNDKKVYDIDNQFMFGPAFLVCPVTEHQYYPISEKSSPIIKDISSYLPSGSTWYDFWTGETYEGGQQVFKETPIDIMPLYVKAGSIIPMGPFMQYAEEYPADPLEIRIYTGAEGTFVFYEDENDNYNYEEGKYTLITFSWDDQNNELIISDRLGEFHGMLKNRTIKIVLVNNLKGIGIELSPQADKEIEYTGLKIKVKF